MTETKSKKPAYIAYNVKRPNDGQAYWTKIGVAFQHQDSKGFNLVLDAFPVNGEVVLRVPEEKNSDEAGN